MERIINALRTLRIGIIIEEYDLQDKIAETLTSAGIGFTKEYKLGRGNRVDFMAEGQVAIEVKKGKVNRSKLIEQIERYSNFEDVLGIVIVVETSIFNPPPKAINGKPCAVISLRKLWGIAL